MATETDDRMLSGMESLMWRLGAEPRLRTTFGAVSFLEATPDRDLLTRRLAEAVGATPRFRRRVVASRMPGMAPAWVDDESFDLDDHLRWDEPVAGQVRADDDALQLATDLVAAPFEPDKPPWELVIVTGLAGGRAALVQRIHHALTDGAGAIEFFERLVDRPPDASVVDPEPDPFPGAPAPEPPATWGERTVLNVAERVGELARSTADVARWTVEGISDPTRFGTAAGDAVETMRSLQRQLVVVDPARSRLWIDRSTERRFVAASVPFGPVHTAATEAGVSVNDVFVTAVARAVANYHRGQGRPLVDLRLAMPVRTRERASAGGDAIALTRTVVPSGEGLAAAAHLMKVADRLSAITNERSNSLVGALAGIAELVPLAALSRLVTRQAATIDVVASNVRTASFPLYLAGARIEATYPLGPLMATPVNVTMITYDGRADLGIHVDPVAVADPQLLRDNLVGAFHEVVTPRSSG